MFVGTTSREVGKWQARTWVRGEWIVRMCEGIVWMCARVCPKAPPFDDDAYQSGHN